jgi:hypothetical protein
VVHPIGQSPHAYPPLPYAPVENRRHTVCPSPSPSQSVLPPFFSPLKMPVGKALVLNEHGGVDKLTLVPDFSFDDTPKAGEVLVHVAATSVNPVDTYVRSGMYPAKSFPLVRQQHVVAASCGAP